MYVCEYSTKSFSNKHHLQRHKREVREGVLRFTCEKCEKKFIRKPNPYLHQRTCCVFHWRHAHFKASQEKKTMPANHRLKKLELWTTNTQLYQCNGQGFSPNRTISTPLIPQLNLLEQTTGISPLLINPQPNEADQTPHLPPTSQLPLIPSAAPFCGWFVFH